MYTSPNASFASSSYPAFAGASLDVIDILKADHHDLVQRFDEVFAQESDGHYPERVDALCTALKIHMAAEAEIFYPTFLRATHDDLSHLCASVSCKCVKDAIDDIEHVSPEAAEYNERVHELYVLFSHHAKDAEKPGGLYDVASHSKLNGAQIGRAMLLRKRELEEEAVLSPA